MSSLLGLFSILATTFVSPFAQAAFPAPLPLPRDDDYLGHVTSQIAGAHFSTDPKGEVAAAGPTSTTWTQDGITIVITKAPSCTRRGDIISYRLTISIPAHSPNPGCYASTTDLFPLQTEYVDAQRTPDIINEDSVVWNEEWEPVATSDGSLICPARTFEYTLRLRVKMIVNRVVNGVTVISSAGKALSDHVASDDGCDTPPFGEVPPAFSTLPLPSGKEPVIICHPAEKGCIPQSPKLGKNFENAKPFIIDFKNETPFSFDQVLYASGNPELGARFKEAIADIIPGECRVIPDDIVLHPKFQDALERRADPANFYMMPIYNSEKDFKDLVQTNIELGIEHLTLVRDETFQLHRKYWLLHGDILTEALKGNITGSEAVSQLNALIDQWRAELNGVMVTLQTEYNDMQQERKENYPRILCAQDLASYDCTTCKAEINVKSAIARACGKDTDAGFCADIDRVKNVYETNLAGRQSDYSTTQSQFLNLQPVVDLWTGPLATALSALDGGDDGPLRAYMALFGRHEQDTYDALFELYKEHAKIDEETDEDVRLNHWEKELEGDEGIPFPYDPDTLDAPKKVVVDCAKEILTKHHVETTWCEVGKYPELILRGAPEPVKARLNAIFLPDTSSLDGSTAVIDPALTFGEPCNPGPGNPWWRKDCSCQCDDLLPQPDVGIDICPSQDDIIKHDYYITSQAECLAQEDDHLNALPSPPPSPSPPAE